MDSLVLRKSMTIRPITLSDTLDQWRQQLLIWIKRTPDTRVLGHPPRDVHESQYLNSLLWHQGKAGKLSMGHSVADCLDLCLRPWGQAAVHLRSPKPLFWSPKGLFHASLSALCLCLQCGLFEPHSLANPFVFCTLHIILWSAMYDLKVNISNWDGIKGPCGYHQSHCRGKPRLLDESQPPKLTELKNLLLLRKFWLCDQTQMCPPVFLVERASDMGAAIS